MLCVLSCEQVPSVHPHPQPFSRGEKGVDSQYNEPGGNALCCGDCQLPSLLPHSQPFSQGKRV
jgi:hypothetical protein